VAPYPVDGAPEEKLAWAKADTARRTDPATTQWVDDDWETDGWAEDWREPRSEPLVDRRPRTQPSNGLRIREPFKPKSAT
jgi:hypothetical protein